MARKEQLTTTRTSLGGPSQALLIAFNGWLESLSRTVHEHHLLYPRRYRVVASSGSLFDDHVLAGPASRSHLRQLLPGQFYLGELPRQAPGVAFFAHDTAAYMLPADRIDFPGGLVGSLGVFIPLHKSQTKEINLCAAVLERRYPAQAVYLLDHFYQELGQMGIIFPPLARELHQFLEQGRKWHHAESHEARYQDRQIVLLKELREKLFRIGRDTVERRPAMSKYSRLIQQGIDYHEGMARPAPQAQATEQDFLDELLTFWRHLIGDSKLPIHNRIGETPLTLWADRINQDRALPLGTGPEGSLPPSLEPPMWKKKSREYARQTTLLTTPDFVDKAPQNATIS